MVTTRNKRRAAAPSLDGGDGDHENENNEATRLLDPQEADTLLEQAETTLGRKNKKKKTEAFKRNHQVSHGNRGSEQQVKGVGA